MPVPVVICDDSSFARKQVANALPKGWDVAITFARNGKEGIEAIRAGQGDVLFLDLTMPEMDGFDVLAAIQREDLPTLPIVISGDIQPENQKRVRQLGAVAFIKKPVDGAELSHVLKDFGLLEILTGTCAGVPVQVDFNDWCQEIANVAMGRAADLLAKVIGEDIRLTIPKVNLIDIAELNMILAATTGGACYANVVQGFIGSGIAGETLLTFHDGHLESLAGLMGLAGELGRAQEYELLMDISNILVGAFLKGFADQLDIKFSQGHPRLHLQHGSGCRLLAEEAEQPKRILCIEIGYQLGEQRVDCDQMVLFTEASLLALKSMADASMEAA